MFWLQKELELMVERGAQVDETRRMQAEDRLSAAWREPAEDAARQARALRRLLHDVYYAPTVAAAYQEALAWATLEECKIVAALAEQRSSDSQQA